MQRTDSPARPYWFNRIYLVVSVVAWLGIGGRSILLFLTSFPSEPNPPWEPFALIPFVLPAFWLGSSARAFRLRYSALGPDARSPLPPDPPVLRARYTGGGVGRFYATLPFVSWMVYREGVGFRIFGLGHGFVPFSDIARSERRLLRGYKVEHTNSEVRSPLLIPSANLLEAIMAGVRDDG